MDAQGINKKAMRILKTYEHDDRLPKLPLPSLEETLDRYLLLLEPFCTTSEELHTLRSEIRKLKDVDAQNSNSDLSKIQLFLKQRHAEKRNYIGNWWEDYAYLSDRSVRVPVESFVPNFPEIVSKLSSPQVVRAAQVVYACTDIFVKLRYGLLSTVKIKGDPVSMLQYKHIFQAYRRPERNMDVLVRNFKTISELDEEQWDDLGYMILGCNSQFYKLRLSVFDTSKKKHRRLTFEEIRDTILYCYKDSNGFSVPKSECIGVLTAVDRDTWATCRETLIKDNTNRMSLTAFEDAAFVLHLDPSSPEKTDERIKEAAIGQHAGTRWYDNCMQWIVFSNGHVGYAMEHSQLDALPVVRIHEELFEIIENMSQSTSSENAAVFDVSFVEKLAWNIPSDVSIEIMKAWETHEKVYSSWKVKCERLKGFGTEILKQNKLSPDSFMQICFQVAYFRLYNHIPSVYETVATTLFLDGRTEAGRSVTLETAKFAYSFDSNEQTNAEKIEALYTACRSHSERIAQARKGKGTDRHIFAMHQAVKENTLGIIPKVLQTTAENQIYQRASCWDLSTSHVTSPKCSVVDHAIAFHPVGVDSIGVVYSMYPYRVDFTIMTDENSQKVDGNLFLKEVQAAFYDLIFLVVKMSNL